MKNDQLASAAADDDDDGSGDGSESVHDSEGVRGEREMAIEVVDSVVLLHDMIMNEVCMCVYVCVCM